MYSRRTNISLTITSKNAFIKETHKLLFFSSQILSMSKYLFQLSQTDRKISLNKSKENSVVFVENLPKNSL